MTLFIHFQPFQPTPAALPTSLAGWMANPSPVPHPSASAGPIGLAAANNAGKVISNFFLVFLITHDLGIGISSMLAICGLLSIMSIITHD